MRGWPEHAFPAAEEDRAFLRKEHSIVVPDPASMPFMERLAADSRAIGLHHTSGLSTPQQVFMDLLALTHLVRGADDPHVRQGNDVVRGRCRRLMEALGLEADNAPANARCHSLVDIREVARRRNGAEFAGWFAKNVSDIDCLNDLAGRKGVVLMHGPGFGTPEGLVRIPPANLEEGTASRLRGASASCSTSTGSAHSPGGGGSRMTS